MRHNKLKLKAREAETSLFSGNNWHAAQFYDRSDETISQQVLQRAFSTAKPKSSPEFVGFTAQNGNYIVLKVSGVREGDAASISAETREGLQSHLARTYGESELQAFINQLKDEADIEVFTDKL